MKQPLRDPYGGRDPREIAAYTTVEAAHYLRIPENTLRAWCFGRSSASRHGNARRIPSVIKVADPARHLLSFVNLLEMHVLDAIRRRHQVELKRIRSAIRYLEDHFSLAHPLVDEAMETDGTDLFISNYGSLINASRHGQMAMREMLKAHLERIDRDQHGLAIRLYPFTRKRDLEGAAPDPKLVSIDPRLAFGRPVLSGSRIPTIEIAERYKAGDSIFDLAEDYGREPFEIEEAIRCELHVDAA